MKNFSPIFQGERIYFLNRVMEEKLTLNERGGETNGL